MDAKRGFRTMSISSQIDHVNGITIFSASGKLTFDEAMAEVKMFYIQPTPNVVWDLRSVSEVNLSSSEIWEIASFRPRHESSKRINGKTAIVTSQDLLFGLSRMFQSFSENEDVPFAVMIFRTMEEAQGWLDNDDT